MDVRQALYEMTASHNLDAAEGRQLRDLAGLDREPVSLSFWLPRGVAVLAATLCGLGVIFFIAANWETLGRTGRFALLQGLFVVMCLGAAFRPAARVPLALLSFLTIGGLFAYFGQTYQTGADPWQLFALWAVLGLPLCLSTRSDVLWTPWVLVMMVAVSLWIQASNSNQWTPHPFDLPVHLIGWAAAILTVLFLLPVWKKLTGAGIWSFRLSIVLLTILLTSTALLGLFQQEVRPHYLAGLMIVIVIAIALSQPRLFDLFGLSVAGLSLNILLVAGAAHLLFSNRHDDFVGLVLFLGMIAAGMLAATVSAIMRLSTLYAAKEVSQ